MSGLTSAGFTPATTSDVQTGIQNDELALIDPALNLAPTQPLGQMNGIFAAAQSKLWSLVAAIYTAFDPDSAIGVQLDNLCAFSGITRFAAFGTLVTCTINLAGGNAYTGAVLGGPAGKQYVVTPGQLTANIVGYPGYVFCNRDAIPSSAAGNVTAVFICIQTGPIAANSGTLTVITTPVTGWNSITNPTNGTTGSAIETDTALRLRRSQSLVANGSSTVDSIRATLLLVANMLQVAVLDNTTFVTDGNGTPGKAFQSVLWDNNLADNTQIAQAIWNTKPSGIQAYGTTGPINAVDATGKNQPMFFTRATQVPIYFVVTVKTTNATAFNAGGGVAAIQAAMIALMAGVLVGGTVIAVAFEMAAFSISGVTDVTSFTLGIAPAPVGVVNLAMSATQQATLIGANITVNVT